MGCRGNGRKEERKELKIFLKFYKIKELLLSNFNYYLLVEEFFFYVIFLGEIYFIKRKRLMKIL